MVDNVLQEVKTELAKARKAHPDMNSAHEGYAVILEELDELWEEAKGHSPNQLKRMREEAVQVAAMAVRFIEDVCDAQSLTG